jgi:filamentous hemagglutinin family protein
MSNTLTMNTPTGYRLVGQLSVTALAVVFATHVAATPVGGVVVAGEARIASAAGSTVVTQSTAKAVINWLSFNTATGETVRFIQPDSRSVTLNRVLGSDPSTLLGNLSSNGQVFLINPGGILFGKGASVNVGGLVASSLNLTDNQFMAGNYQFVAANPSATAVTNEGTIQVNADGGFVALLGHHVRNDGTIIARLGSVALVGGAAITLDFGGDGLLNVVVDQGVVQAQASNGGLIAADGGLVLLSTQAVGELLHTVVNNTGVIQAQTIDQRSGVIRLLGDMQSGTVNVGGALRAQGGALAGDGGFIETSAAQVIVAEGASVNTLAAHGKTGTWLLDPTDFTIASAGGDIATATLVNNLLASNVTISSNDGRSGVADDIRVNSELHWAGATTLTLNAVHDVRVGAPVTMDTAGARLVLNAGNDVITSLPITAVAAGSAIKIQAGHDVVIGAALHAIAAGSSILMNAANDLHIGGAITATAANSVVDLQAGRDATISAAMIAVAAGSLIKITASRDITTSTTAAIAASAATTQIELNAGRDISVNSAIAAGAAGSGIGLLAGLASTGPGAIGGTVKLAAAVAAPTIRIRFNPDGYANTGIEIAKYPALADAKAWVYTQGDGKVYDGTSVATLSFQGQPADGGAVSLTAGTASFADKAAGSHKAITFSGYQLGGMDANKFALFAASGTATADITQRVLNVAATGVNRVYDGSISGQVVLTDNRMAGDLLALSYTRANFVDKNVGNNKVLSVTGVQVSGADAGNYQVSSTAASLANVTQAELTITASNAEKTFGQTPLLTAFTAVGLVNGETIGSVTETSLGVLAKAGVTTGPYVIQPSQPVGGTFTASNYLLNYRNGSLKVKPAPMVVTAANDTKFFGSIDEITAFSMTGLVNGDTVGAFKISSPGASASASVAGSPYPISLSQASGGTFVASNYSIVYVNGVLTILPQLPATSTGLASPSLITKLAGLRHDIALTVKQADAPPGLQTMTPAEGLEDASAVPLLPAATRTAPYN